MKNIIYFILLSFLMASFQSCGGDDTPIEDIKTKIKYRITCDMEDAQMHIDANGLGALGLYVKNSFENELKTKDYFAVVKVRCEDPKALITIDLYIGKKHFRRSGNSSVFISERLKGTGPYLE